MTDRIIMTVIAGHPSRDGSLAMVEQFQALIADMREPIWVTDCSQLQGFEANALTAGQAWFQAFKARGGRELVVTTPTSRWMMAARAMGLGFGVRIQQAPTLDRSLVVAREIEDGR